MRILHSLLIVSGFALLATSAQGGTVYKVTSVDGEKTIKYEVTFGGGRLFEQMTAFDPVAKKFVYLKWNRSDARPKPASHIWDHNTGKTVPLYTFPGAKHPLPEIPSIMAMKVCPKTGDTDFKAKPFIAID